MAVEGYRSEQLSRGQVSELLGLNFWETEALLKEHEANLHYSKEDLEQDARANERVLANLALSSPTPVRSTTSSCALSCNGTRQPSNHCFSDCRLTWKQETCVYCGES